MARGRQPQPDDGRPVWERRGVQTLFHYTRYEVAVEIDRTRFLIASGGTHHGLGSGIFFTTIRPNEMSAHDLRVHLFDNARLEDSVEAVVVLFWDGPLATVRSLGRRHYMLRTSPLHELDCALVYRGWGHRVDTPEGWMFSQGIYRPLS